jgi:hypothetical protein
MLRFVDDHAELSVATGLTAKPVLQQRGCYLIDYWLGLARIWSTPKQHQLFAGSGNEKLRMRGRVCYTFSNHKAESWLP